MMMMYASHYDSEGKKVAGDANFIIFLKSSRKKMALASLKYSLGSSAIKQWDSAQKNFYEKVWKNEEKFYTYVGIFVGALILIGLFLIIAFSGAGSSGVVKFDPYQVMGLDKNCTDKEVKSQFRRLSRTM